MRSVVLLLPWRASYEGRSASSLRHMSRALLRNVGKKVVAGSTREKIYCDQDGTTV